MFASSLWPAVALAAAIASPALAQNELRFAARAEGGRASIDARNETGIRQYCVLAAVFRGLRDGGEAIYTFNCAAAIETGATEEVCRKDTMPIVDAQPAGEVRAKCRPATPEELETLNR